MATCSRAPRASCAPPLPVDVVDTFSPSVQTPTCISLFELSKIPKASFRFGGPSYGREQLDYLDFAIEKARRGMVAAIVTGPMTKEAVAKVAPGFVGHTGYLAEELGVHDERMAFLTPEYILALQTTHIPLADVAKNLTQRGIATTIAMLAAAGRKVLRPPNCRSPCSGSTRTLANTGCLDWKKIESSCRPWHRPAAGAGPATGHSQQIPSLIARVKRYKLILAMYHDQGLVAVKPAFPRVSVNITLGLPVVRTSVDHGSGYDIAGKGKADETSMLYAIKAALELTRT